MTTIAVVSGRNLSSGLAEYCARDFEDAIIDSAEAHLFCPARGEITRVDSDLIIVVALTFDTMASLLMLAKNVRGSKVVGYVFGAYGILTNVPRNPVRRWRKRAWYDAFSKLDHLYIGFDNWIDDIARNLSVETTYLPMAANVLAVNAKPCSPEFDRPIGVAAFGRQHIPTVNALADAFNHSSSDILFYNTNFLNFDGAADAQRYRDMFWQVLRQSKIALCFDHLAAPNPGGARCSYVGPRWYESLASGAVIAGFAPRSVDCGMLLDWPDATIELPEDPEDSVEVIRDLISDNSRLAAISARNLAEMNMRHDWRHRLSEICESNDFSVPQRLRNQLELLSSRASALTVVKNSDHLRPSQAAAN